MRLMRLDEQLASLRDEFDAETRGRLRAELADGLRGLQHGLDLATEALDGPDPQSAVGFSSAAIAIWIEAVAGVLDALPH